MQFPEIENVGKEVEERLSHLERRTNCHARRILDLQDRMLFCGRLTVVALALSTIAIVMAVLF